MIADVEHQLRNGCTWHLNLRWTVGDMERLQFICRFRRHSAETIAAMLNPSVYRCTPDKIREIADAFGIALPQDNARAAK